MRKFIRAKKGYSLIELVLVIGLLAVTSVSLVVMSFGFSETRLENAAHKVRLDIEYAKQHAMTTGQTSGVKFVNKNAYTVYENSILTPLPDPLTQQDMIILISDLYAGVEVRSNITYEFDRFGKPTQGANRTMQLRSGSLRRRIRVQTATGKVEFR